MTDNELLLAISHIVQTQIEPLKHDIKDLKNDIRDIKMTIENDIRPRLQNIESCYTDTYKRYSSGANQIESMQSDIDLLKKVVTEHSEKLNQSA